MRHWLNFDRREEEERRRRCEMMRRSETKGKKNENIPADHPEEDGDHYSLSQTT